MQLPPAPSLTTAVHAYSNLNNNYKNQYVYISTLGHTSATAANLCLIHSYIIPPTQL